MKNTKISKKELNSFKLQTELMLFDLYAEYEQKRESKNFVSFTQLHASVLLSFGDGFEAQSFKTIQQRVNLAQNKKYDIVFNKFVISFERITKYSSNILSPVIAQGESSTNDAVILSHDSELTLSRYLVKLNQEIDKLIDEGNFVEVIPYAILYRSTQSKKLKLSFGKEMLATIKE
ncbi:DUF2714 domain-containing protein [Mycoplasmopsis phocirhinis]|uniref:DUF2714 domain-containing protein n=1 Tax=Mycoplasmopsis phocirhinis TaxID=142650 RepID=A0A4P6MNL9_9BACT|nr:DUF2714 domain-containing protein [Mycoplasmopsis phocirhinis]QBF34603.1 DUF2714 domain-containing protein [Mycoplasmopsis phocirhinis]